MTATRTLLLRRLVLSALFLCFFSPRVNAQNAGSSSADSTNFGFLPALAYNSDFGFLAGGVASWYAYKDDTRPFYSYTNFAGVISTKGLLTFNFFYDKPHVFGSNVRMTNEMYVSRFFEDSYFGIANYTKLEDPPPGNSGYYYFKSFSTGFENTLRFPVYKGPGDQQLDAKTIINTDYETPWDNKDSVLISLERPTGFEGGRTLYLGGGLIWENRDHEFRPTKGNYAELAFEAGNSLWGSNFNTFHLEFDVRQYATFHLIRDVTFANRVYIEHSRGDVPYWKLSYAGGEESIRGYPSRRFMDDNLAIWNSELRTWLFSINQLESRFGGVLFFDLGRTFPNGMPVSELTSDLKYSFGFAGTASFFTPDFIIRGDVGFSEEGTGIYITTGYMF